MAKFNPKTETTEQKIQFDAVLGRLGDDVYEISYVPKVRRFRATRNGEFVVSDMSLSMLLNRFAGVKWESEPKIVWS